MALSVSDQCRSCIVTLQEITSILAQTHHGDRHVTHAQVSEELDRFSLFIGNIGALHRPESPMSIESRLQEANDVLTHILSLLNDLNDVSRELLDIVSGKREGMVSVADEAEDENEEEVSEVNELREEISGTITRLFRISVLIRQAAPTDIFAKALSRNRYHFSDQFDIAHVGEKYPKLATKDNAWLRQRLGRAITQRRHYISYIQDHRDKLGSIKSHHEKENSAVDRFQTPIIKQLPSSKSILDTESRPSFFTKATTIAAEQITPRLHVAENLDSEDDARSYTTVSRSIDGDHESLTTVRIPKLETLRVSHEKEFECPFCFRIKKFKSERIWRKHVFVDLRPYVCTFINCDAPYFGDINEWFQHEMMFHRVSYKCFLCPNKTYYDEGKYTSHLRREHADMIDDDGEQPGRDLARKPLAQIPASDCPCCSDWADRLKEREIETSGSSPTGTLAVTPVVFKRHLAGHLEQLALFAVPIAATTDDNENSNVAMEQVKSKHTDSSQLSTLTFASFRGDLEDAASATQIDSSTHAEIQITITDGKIKTEPLSSPPRHISNSRDQDLSDRRNMLTDTGDGAEGHSDQEESQQLQDESDEPEDESSEDEGEWEYIDGVIQGEEEFVLKEIKTAKEIFGQDYARRLNIRTLDMMSDLINNYQKQGRWEEAKDMFLELVKASEAAFGPDDDTVLKRMAKLAEHYMLRYQWVAAEKLLVHVVEAKKKKGTLVSSDDIFLSCASNLAIVKNKLGKSEEAEIMCKEAVELGKRCLGPDYTITLSEMKVLLIMLTEMGKFEEAVVIYRDLLTIYEKLRRDQSKQALLVRSDLARTLSRIGKLEEAETEWRKTLELQEKAYSPLDRETRSSRIEFVYLLIKRQKFEEAETICKQAPVEHNKVRWREHRDTTILSRQLAFAIEHQGRLEEAEVVYRQIVEMEKRKFGDLDKRIIEPLRDLARVLEKQGRTEEAEAVRKQMEDIQVKSSEDKSSKDESSEDESSEDEYS
jgi:pentatricopeptide repeat protein